MTYDEITKALECCSREISTEHNCSLCPMRGKRDCMTILYREALVFINRQKAEIARLRKYDEERDIRLHARLTETAKAEARKECAKEICEEIIKRFDRLLKAEPNRGTTTSAKDFLEAHLPYVINSILKGITEDAGK